MKDVTNLSLSLVTPPAFRLNTGQKLGLTTAVLGIVLLLLALFGVHFPSPGAFLALSLGLMAAGGVWYARSAYDHEPAGIRNNGVWHRNLTGRGAFAWGLGIALTALYVLLYWFPQYLGLGQDGAPNTGLIALFDPLCMALEGHAASQWFVYGTLYTLAILVMGYKFIRKYRHNRYQVIRTISVMFFQLGFAFLLPEILLGLNKPYNDFKNMWPLNYYFFEGWHIKELIGSGTLGLFMLVWGVLMILLISPVLTWFYGKRWYCSWVCGCGGLAETAGDPFRHLSDKRVKAWRIERWMIHLVLVFATAMTIAVLYGVLHQAKDAYLITKAHFVWGLTGIFVLLAAFLFLRPKYFKNLAPVAKWTALGVAALLLVFLWTAYLKGSSRVFFMSPEPLRKWYGFLIGSAFSGVIGVGFYPLMGSRVWCRFGCPMAAILGIQQKFLSRFRITTNGGQCISCGNCSAYCEMGIDVRAYAQKGQDVVRASCVGCGICAAVCPRGVLRLENSAADVSERAGELRALRISEAGVKVVS